MGEGDGTMGQGPSGAQSGFGALLSCIPCTFSIHSDGIYRTLSISLGLGGEDILGSRINFFPRKSLPISIFLSLLSNLGH